MAKSFYLIFLLSIAAPCLHAMEPSLANLRNAAIWTPLHTAISVGNMEAVKGLLTCGADIEAKTSHEKTPLIFSAEYDKNAIAQFLLEKGAVVNAADKDGSTALHIGCKRGYPEIIETLVLKGATLDTLDKNQKSSLHYALAYKEYADATILVALQKALKKKFDAEIADEGFSLHRACQAENADGLEELVLKGARLDELDKSGNSPLHYAAANTNPVIMNTLLAALKKKTNPEAAQPNQDQVPAAVSLSCSSLPAPGTSNPH